jgi:hypothetical protein
MRQALLFSSAALVLGPIACGYGQQARSTEITGQAQITSGPVGSAPELSRLIAPLSERIAAEVCSHEKRCGHPDVACVDDTVARASEELSRWSCSPAAARARIEECLAGIDESSCEASVRSPHRAVCPGNAACGRNAELVSPGRALAERATP